MKNVNIYISATTKDLIIYRESINKHIRNDGFEDPTMDYYMAKGSIPLAKCLESVRNCDVYIGIFAWRYGFIPDSAENYDKKSLIELEYREAISHQKKCYIFLLSEEYPWPPRYFDSHNHENNNGGNILALRNDARINGITESFTSSEDLVLKVKDVLKKWCDSHIEPQQSHCANIYREYSSGHILNKNEFTESNSLYVELYSVKPTPENQHLLDYKDFEDNPGEIISKVEVKFNNEQSYTNKILPIAEELIAGFSLNPNKIIVIGQSGSGKTTLLRYITYRLASDFSDYLPIMFVLENHWPAISKDGLLKRIITHTGLDDQNIRDLINKGKLVILLDGFNEVPSVHLQDLRSQLSVFVTDFPFSRIIISSRHKITLVGHENTFIEKQLQLMDKNQAINLIAKRKFNENEIDGEVKAAALWERIRNSNILNEEKISPYFLGIITDLLFENFQEVYESMGAVTRNFVKIVLKGELIKKGYIDGTPEISRKIAEIIRKVSLKSYFLVKEDRLSFQYEEILEELEYCLSASLLEYYDEDDKIFLKFGHENLRDFFAANFLETSRYKIAEIIDVWDKMICNLGQKSYDELIYRKEKANLIVLSSELSNNPSDFLMSEQINMLSPEWREVILLGTKVPKACVALSKFCSLGWYVGQPNVFLLNSELGVRKAAALSLSKINSDSSRYELLKLTENNSSTTRLFATVALGKSIETPEISAKLITLIFDTNIRVASKAIKIVCDRIKYFSCVLKKLLDFYYLGDDYEKYPNIRKAIGYRIESKENDKSPYLAYNDYLKNEIDQALCSEKISLRDAGIQLLRVLGPAIDPPNLISPHTEIFSGVFYTKPLPGIKSNSFSSIIPCLLPSRKPGIKNDQHVKFTVKQFGDNTWIVDKILN